MTRRPLSSFNEAEAFPLRRVGDPWDEQVAELQFVQRRRLRDRFNEAEAFPLRRDGMTAKYPEPAEGWLQ